MPGQRTMKIANKLRNVRFNPPGNKPQERLAFINRQEADLLRAIGGSGRMTKHGVPSFSWRDDSSSSDTGGAGSGRGSDGSQGGARGGGGGGVSGSGTRTGLSPGFTGIRNLGLTTGRITGTSAYGTPGGMAVGMGAPGFENPAATARTMAARAPAAQSYAAPRAPPVAPAIPRPYTKPPVPVAAPNPSYFGDIPEDVAAATARAPQQSYYGSLPSDVAAATARAPQSASYYNGISSYSGTTPRSSYQGSGTSTPWSGGGNTTINKTPAPGNTVYKTPASYPNSMPGNSNPGMNYGPTEMSRADVPGLSGTMDGGRRFGSQRTIGSPAPSSPMVNAPEPARTSTYPARQDIRNDLTDIHPLGNPEKFSYPRGMAKTLTGVNPDALNAALQTQNRYGGKLITTSGLRNPLMNKAVGGVGGSQHILGNALDFAIPDGASGASTARLLDAMRRSGFTGLGGYRPGKVHGDVRARAATWGPDTHASSIGRLPQSMRDALKGQGAYAGLD